MQAVRIEASRKAHVVKAKTPTPGPGDILIITAGIPHGGPGRTNMIKVHVV